MNLFKPYVFGRIVRRFSRQNQELIETADGRHVARHSRYRALTAVQSFDILLHNRLGYLFRPPKVLLFYIF